MYPENPEEAQVIAWLYEHRIWYNIMRYVRSIENKQEWSKHTPLRHRWRWDSTKCDQLVSISQAGMHPWKNSSMQRIHKQSPGNLIVLSDRLCQRRSAYQAHRGWIPSPENIKDVSSVCDKVYGHNTRHGVINQMKKLRLDLPIYEAKTDFLHKLKNLTLQYCCRCLYF